jgi:glycolate oxidase FAD binding subunit
VPLAGRATLGGVLAANTSGPRRFGYGTLRDYVIGISALNDAGQEFKAGGRVVKNVAGYDLCKLLVGSLGTLGIITQATLKLRPLAEEQVLVCIGCEAAELDAMLTRLHATRTRPGCLELLNQSAARVVYQDAKIPAPDASWTLLVGYDGNQDAVTWQVQQLVREVGAHDRIDARVGFTAQPLYSALTEWAGWPEAHTTFKANLLPSAVAEFCLQAEREPNPPQIRAHAGNGIVEAAWGPGLTKDDAARMLTVWRERARAAQGSVIVPLCPADWKSTLSVWGPAPSAAWLMREVKAKFDPRRIFNPGRFVDEL